ncbi:MAG: hypothetical protein IJJ45_03550 [Clostridia bacterium]|nr:hypothetical protein [Clostridia bacterium]
MMLKRIVIAMLACMLVFSASAEVKWQDVEKEVNEAGITGRFVTFDALSVKLWVPDSLRETKLDEPELDDGYIAVFTNAAETASIEVQYVSLEEDSLQDYVSQMRNDGFALKRQTINGLNGLRFLNKEDDMVVYAFATKSGKLFIVTCTPVGSRNLAWIWNAVGASIQRK